MFTPSIPILCYHDIFDGGSHGLAQFGEHLDAIVDAGFTTISAQDLFGIVTGTRKPVDHAVVLTFDDGHISNFLNAAPALQQRGMVGVFFALTDFIETAPPREPAAIPAPKPLPDCFRDSLLHQDYSQFINSGEIKSLIDAGHEVYAHGSRHQATFRTLDHRYPMGHPKAHWAAWSIYPQFDPALPTFTEGSAYVYDGFWPTGKANEQGEPILRRRTTSERQAFCRQDMTASFERMRELNKTAHQFFCWPWGQFDTESEEELKRAGFSAAFTLERGANSPGTDPFRLNRLGVGRTKDGAWIQRRLSMYRRKATARIFFKKLRKRPEIKHVLYATDSVKLSGGSRQLVNNARAMLDLGLDVTVLVPPKSAIPTALPAAAQVLHCDHFKRSTATAFLLRDVIRERGIDVVHTFHNKAYKAGVLAKIMGGGFRLFINRGVIFNPNTLFGLWARIANGMIVNSFACAASLAKVKVPDSRINVVYNSFLPEGPAPQDRGARRKRGVRILYVGNEAPAKGLDVYLRMCQTLAETHDLRDVEFAIAGAQKLEEFASIITPQVRERLLDLGLMPHAQVLKELLFADILVLSSRLESLPNVLPEAYHAALPVVCTNAGGVPELVANGVGGFLCPVEDHQCLAEKVWTLMENFSLRVSMGKANQRIVSGLLSNRRKGLELLQVYHGRRIASPLALDSVNSDTPEP
ncbi:MAG: glycosyltransferase [Proteobacteria bacterium]|nr:glycosyltransferase [Pseudomonadota bacterium]